MNEYVSHSVAVTSITLIPSPSVSFSSTKRTFVVCLNINSCIHVHSLVSFQNFRYAFMRYILCSMLCSLEIHSLWNFRILLNSTSTAFYTWLQLQLWLNTQQLSSGSDCACECECKCFSFMFIQRTTLGLR